MIIASVRARVTKDIPGALGWAQDIAAFVQKKTGNEVEVLARTGATQDIVWLQRFQDLAAYEKAGGDPVGPRLLGADQAG